MEFRLASVDSFIIYFGDEIDKKINQEVKKAFAVLKKSSLDGIIELVPSYSSLFVTYDIFKYEYDEITQKVKEVLKSNKNSEVFESKLVEIDVYYGLEVGFDLHRISEIKNISIPEIISIHSSKIYDVYAIGFLPAFAYLWIVDKKIATNRLENPRTKIPKNSVAIANTQTAIYPLDSPGGWNIIGRTYQNIFDKKHENLSLISFNDKVKFNPISKDEFLCKGGIFESWNFK